jgi:hypothetical protein
MHDQADMYESARVRCVRLLTYIDSLATTTSDPTTTHKQVAPVTVMEAPPNGEGLRSTCHCQY